MTRNFAAALVLLTASVCWAAKCTTVLDPRALREYNAYVARTIPFMSDRFEAGELTWIVPSLRNEAAARLAAGKLVQANISDGALNRQIAARNGTVLHWIGAVRIRGATLDDLKTVLEDYASYDRMYRPIVFGCEARRNGGSDAEAAYDVILGLHNTFRFASVFPQHYSFRVKARMEHSSSGIDGARRLLARLMASEIRESDSGVPGKSDYLEPYHDHGIMWALNAWWRARRQGTGLYLEFETITLARSVQAFACKVSFVPVPKTVVAGAMDSMPADSVRVILEGTRAECERRVTRSSRSVAGQ